MKEKLKKHWKIIVICLLAIFGLSKCTSSCNRGIKVKELSERLSVMDSITTAQIDSLNTIILEQSHKIDIMNEKVSGLETLNSEVKKERQKTDDAYNEVKKANSRANALKRENESLKNKNK